MAIDKEAVLINSFEVLMKNYDDNLNNINKLIVKMVSLNIELAIELWTTILKRHPETYRGTQNWNSSYVTTSILGGVERKLNDNYDTCVDILKSEHLIKEATFRYSSDLDYPLDSVLWRAVARSEYTFVYECMEMISENKSADKKVNNFIVDLIEAYEDGYLSIEDSDIWKSNTVDFILSLTSLLKTQKDRAIVDVALIDYM